MEYPKGKKKIYGNTPPIAHKWCHIQSLQAIPKEIPEIKYISLLILLLLEGKHKVVQWTQYNYGENTDL